MKRSAARARSAPYPIAMASASCSSKLRRSPFGRRARAVGCGRARETPRRGDLLRLARDEHAEAHELTPDAELGVHGAAADAIARTRRPARAVEVAKPARAALHVGLEQVHRSAEALVTRHGLRVEAIDEGAEILLAEESLVRARHEIVHRRVVPLDEPKVEQGRRRRQVGLGERQRVGHGEDLMPDRERRVPQRIEEALGEGRGVAGADLAGVHDHHHIGVAAERHGAAAEAAHGREREALDARAGRQPRCARRLGESRVEAGLQEPGVGPAKREPVFPGREALDEDGAVAIHGFTQTRALRRGWRGR